MQNFHQFLAGIQEQLWNPTLIAGVIESALSSVDPYQSVKRSMRLEMDSVFVDGTPYPLLPESKIHLIAIGKAAELMTLAAMEVLGDKVYAGVCVPKYPAGLLQAYPQVVTIKGDHPVPGEGSLKAGKSIQELLQGLSPDDLVLVLLSGGGSSLATLPADNIDLQEMKRMTDELLLHGQPINDINTVRKHLDLLKGGGILRMAQPAKVVSLILSDVIGDPLDVIASGPTVPDPTTFHQAYHVLHRTNISPSLIPNIIHRLSAGTAGEILETYKGIEPGIQPAQNVLIGSNRIACEEAKEQAISLGMRAEVVTTELNGEASAAGRILAAYARRLREQEQKGVFIFGGETTVTIRGRGLGGRNLETALAAVEGMAGVRDCVLVTLATDGDDGPSQAAGAVVTGETASRAAEIGLDPIAYLAENDSFHFFKQLGNLLVTGPTGTNVNDLDFLFLF